MNSIVDYLNSIGHPSDFNSRVSLAASKGISNYTGTAEQNLQLLNLMKQPNDIAQNAPVNTPTPTKTPEQIKAEADAIQKDKINTKVAEAAGQSGMSYDDLTKLYASQTGITTEEATKINKDLGIPDLENIVFKTAPSTEKLYNDAYAVAGLSDVKTKINDLLTKIKTKEDAMNQRLLQIDENPWLSEATRAKSVQREKDFFDRSVANDQDMVKALTDTYNSGINEINGLVQRQTTDFTNNYNLNSKKLEYLQKKAENQTQTLQSSKSAGFIKYLPSYLQAKTQSQKPDTIGSSETGFYRWDPMQGKFVLAVAGTGKKATEADKKRSDIADMSSQLDIAVQNNRKQGSKDNYLNPDQYIKARKAWVNGGSGTAKEFDESFVDYRNPNDQGYNLAQ